MPAKRQPGNPLQPRGRTPLPPDRCGKRPGGEQQRIGILRAIVAKPKVLLMDEPFSALDPISRRQLQDITKQLQSELGITLVFVTHDMKEAMRLADRICVIKEGKIVQLDRPEIIQNNPSDQFVRTLFEEEN